MASFSIDFKKLHESIDNFKWSVNGSVNDVEFIHQFLVNNVSNSWNDEKSNVFLDIVKKNEYSIVEYLDKLKLSFSKIEEFSKSLNNVCSQLGYGYNLSSFKFSDANKLTLKKNFDKSILCFDESLLLIESNVDLLMADEMLFLLNLKANLTDLKFKFNKIIEEVDSFFNKVNVVLNDFQVDMSSFGDNILSAKEVDFYSDLSSGKFSNSNLSSNDLSSINSSDVMKESIFMNNDLNHVVDANVMGFESNLVLSDVLISTSDDSFVTQDNVVISSTDNELVASDGLFYTDNTVNTETYNKSSNKSVNLNLSNDNSVLDYSDNKIEEVKNIIKLD